MGKASRTKKESQRRAAQAMNAPEKRHRIGQSDSREKFRVDLKIRLPGGLLRSEYETAHAETLVTDSEADLMRFLIGKMLAWSGYNVDARAGAGLLAEALNAFPKAIRGQLAMGLIAGTGVLVTTDTIEVCKDCGGEKERTIHPDPENAPLECFGSEHEGEHQCDCVPMLDTTKHGEVCHVNRVTSETGAPLNPVEYVEQEAVLILQPPRYEPLNQQEPPMPGLGSEPVTAESLEPVEDSEADYEFVDTDGVPVPA